jgi:hypothetical protein
MTEPDPYYLNSALRRSNPEVVMKPNNMSEEDRKKMVQLITAFMVTFSPADEEAVVGLGLAVGYGLQKSNPKMEALQQLLLGAVLGYLRAAGDEQATKRAEAGGERAAKKLVDDLLTSLRAAGGLS